jgi:hypothetical protein
MNTIILLKVFALTNNVNVLATYYKNISANILITQRFSGFPKISYSIYNDIKNKNNQKLFQYASSHGHLEIVKYLLSNDHDIDPAADDNEAIRRAVIHGHLNVVKYLISTVLIDPATEDNFAIRWLHLTDI